MFNDAQMSEFDKWGKTRPVHIAHGVNSDNLHEHMKQLMPYSWKLEGNKLTGMTDMGPLVQNIPTDYILSGTDDKGLPIFDKVKIQ